MGLRTLSIATGAAMLALSAAALAAPPSIVSSENVSVRPLIEKASYCHRGHHWRYRAYHPRCYGYAAPVVSVPVAAADTLGYYGYSAPPVTAPVAETADVAAPAVAAAAPVVAAPVVAATVAAAPVVGYYGYSAPVPSVAVVAADGIYCATSVKTCLLQEPGWLGTGCSCRVPGGYARGVVE